VTGVTAFQILTESNGESSRSGENNLVQLPGTFGGALPMRTLALISKIEAKMERFVKVWVAILMYVHSLRLEMLTAHRQCTNLAPYLKINWRLNVQLHFRIRSRAPKQPGRKQIYGR
jgi:hypothetical protein